MAGGVTPHTFRYCEPRSRATFALPKNVGLSRQWLQTAAVPPYACISGRGNALHFSVMRTSLASDFRITEKCRVARSMCADGGCVPVRRQSRDGVDHTRFGNANIARERLSHYRNCRVVSSMVAEGGHIHARMHWRKGYCPTLFGNANLARGRRSHYRKV